MRKMIALLVALLLCFGLLAGCGSPAPAAPATPTPSPGATPDGAGADDGHTYIAMVIRSLSNPFHQMVIRGVHMFAEYRGIPEEYVLILLHDGDSERLLRDMQAQIARTGGNIVFQVDPNQMSDLIPIAEIAEEAGVYWTSIWRRPDEIRVSDYEHWVSAINFDDFQSGYQSGRALFEAMGGEGELWVLDGTAGHAAAMARREGLDYALTHFPGITLVGAEDCGWELSRANASAGNAVAAFPNLAGIWSANDNMAIGAIEALRARGLAGEVKVAGVNAIPDMIDAIINGEAVATISTDPLWQGGIGMAMALDAKRGIHNHRALGEEYRYWLADVLLITTENAQYFLDNYINGNPTFDYTDYFGGKYLGPA